MAFELGSIIARIKADTSDFQGGIASAKQKLGGFSGGIEAATGSSKLFLGGIVAVGAALTAAGGFAVKSAAGIESTRAAFETMLGDGQKAGQLMKELQSFAAETPFEFPELADAGKKLLAFGFSAQDVQPQLRKLGDIASGLNIPIGELSELYGKARVQGRLYMEDINQLTGRGIPVIQEFAKQFNVSEGEVRNLVETGKIGFPELEKAVDSLTGKGGQFAGGMLKQSTTLNGMLSTLSDNVGAFARTLVGIGADGSVATNSIFDLTRRGLGGLLDWLNANQQKILDGIGSFLGFIKDNAPIVAGIILAMLVPAFIALGGAVWTAVSGFVVAMAPFVAIGAAVGAIVMLIVNAMGGWGNVMNALGGVWNTLVGYFNNFVSTVWPLLQAAFEFLRPSLEQLGNVIMTQLWPALQNLFNMLVQVWNNISPVLIPALQILGAILGVIIVGAIFIVINTLSFLIGIISSVINWVASLGDFFSGVINMIIMIVTGVGIVIGAVFAAAFAAIVFGLNFVFAFFAAIFNTILAIVGFVLNAIGGYWNMLVGIVMAVINGIVNIVRNLIQGNVVGAFQAAIDAVKNIWNAITGFFSGLWNGIVDGVKNVGEGITKPFRQAVDTIKNLMQGAKDALSNLNPFQRHSPSLVDWIKRGTGVITGEYDKINNAISAGSTAARIESIGTAKSFANQSATEIAAGASGGAGRGDITINVEGVLADSPEAKRRFGVDLINLINDGLVAKGSEVIPT